MVSGLKPGVCHLRAVNTDKSVTALEDYCAFEVMIREKGALPPPLISGLPYLYCSRTETIGLMPDAFDPWFAKSADERHYMPCTVLSDSRDKLALRVNIPAEETAVIVVK